MKGMEKENRNSASPIRIYAQIREDLDRYFPFDEDEEKVSLGDWEFRLRWFILHLKGYGDLLENFFLKFHSYFEGTYPDITGLRDGLFGARMPNYYLINEFLVEELEKRIPQSPAIGSE
jgi:hypothetical protein